MRACDLPTSQRTILITGCSSGIGHHCAIALKQKGYRVFATARDLENVAQLKMLGLDAYRLDVNDSDSIKSALKQILNQTGNQLFALFNNAGYGQPGAVEDLSRQAIREQFETNLFGVLELTNQVLPIMRQQGYGRIVQHSSVLGIINLPFRGAYNASKHALESLSDTLRLELHPTSIYVSLIETGPVKSHFRTNAYQKFLLNIDISQSPFQSLYRLLIKRLSDDISEPPFTLGPGSVEKALLKALNDKKPKTRYFVTLPTYMYAFLKWCLPDKMLDKILILSAGEEGNALKKKINHHRA